MHLGISRKLINIPLYEMVREIAESIHSQRGMTRFNNLPLEKQLEHFDTPFPDAKILLEASEKMVAGRVSKFKATKYSGSSCELGSRIYHETFTNWFFNGKRGIYFEVEKKEGDIILTPKISVKNTAYISHRTMLPSMGSGAPRVEKGDIELNQWCGFEGRYNPNSPKSYGYEIQEITPSLRINMLHKDIDEVYIKKLKEAVANSP
jgi:hypothetical protein